MGTRLRHLCLTLTAAALLAAPALAGGGNSDAAQQCNHGGWQTLHRSDGSERLLIGLEQGDIDLAVAFTQPDCAPEARHRWTEQVTWTRGPHSSPSS